MDDAIKRALKPENILENDKKMQHFLRQTFRVGTLAAPRASLLDEVRSNLQSYVTLFSNFDIRDNEDVKARLKDVREEFKELTDEAQALVVDTLYDLVPIFAEPADESIPTRESIFRLNAAKNVWSVSTGLSADIRLGKRHQALKTVREMLGKRKAQLDTIVAQSLDVQENTRKARQEWDEKMDDCHKLVKDRIKGLEKEQKDIAQAFETRIEVQEEVLELLNSTNGMISSLGSEQVELLDQNKMGCLLFDMRWMRRGLYVCIGLILIVWLAFVIVNM